MTVLLLHNFYLQAGGEDAAAANEAQLLEQNGHTVIRLTWDNREISRLHAIRLGSRTVWSRTSHATVREWIRSRRVDVLHCHNTFPLASPSVYYAARRERVPVVQTLHNYRLLCPSAILYRAGAVCEECIGSTAPWKSVAHCCYRGSRAASAATALMLTAHRLAGTWTRAVDRYIALTPFCREKFIEGGLPADRIAVKPNFLQNAPVPGDGSGGYALFAGRLVEEKGIRTLLHAWTQLPDDIPLRIAGSGPLEPEVARAATSDKRIDWVGQASAERVQELMRGARFLVFPSLWYEAGPMAILEAFACGTPVIGSNLGSTGSLVRDGETGFHFRAGDALSLACKVRAAWAAPQAAARMRAAARKEFEREYGAENNYRRLLEIYRDASEAAAGAAGAQPS